MTRRWSGEVVRVRGMRWCKTGTLQVGTRAKSKLSSFIKCERHSIGIKSQPTYSQSRETSTIKNGITCRFPQRIDFLSNLIDLAHQVVKVLCIIYLNELIIVILMFVVQTRRRRFRIWNKESSFDPHFSCQIRFQFQITLAALQTNKCGQIGPQILQ